MGSQIDADAVYQMRLLDGSAEQSEWVEVSEVEFHTPLNNDSQWERRILYAHSYPSSPSLASGLTDEARHCAFVLNQLAGLEEGDIVGDSIELRFELDGVETGATVSITDYSNRAAAVIARLLTIVDSTKSDIVTLKPDRQADSNCAESSGRTAVLRHFDDIAFDNFALACKAKLAMSREKGRGGWQDRSLCADGQLARMLVGHTFKGNEGTFEDVATFAMMLHQRGADPVVLANEAERLRSCIPSVSNDQPLAYAYSQLTPHFIRNYLSLFERYGTVPKDESVVIQALRIALDGMTRCRCNQSTDIHSGIKGDQV